jgi:putative transcriptional regulator
MEINTDIFKIKYNNIIPNQGLVLVSEPFSPDGVFSRAVVLLVEHNEQGSVGFILNKPINKKLTQLSKEFGNFDIKVSFGGPVSNKNIYYLHTYGNKIPGSIQIKDNLYWGGDFAILQTLMESGSLDESKIRFFVGYSGWSPEQLSGEIKKDYWLVSDIEVDTVMKYEREIWNKVVAKLDKRYSIWQHFPENPNLN